MVVNGTVLAVLLPVIITDLGLTNTQAAWANSAFALVFAALLLPAGWLGDRWGQRRVLVAGLILFLIGAVLVGTASSGATFIAARAIQGAAGAMISPSALAIVNSTFRGSQRVAAFGVWGAVMGGMAGLGPLMGGWIGDEWGWRAAFLLNVPLVILALLGIRRVLDDVQPGVARRFDLVGLLLSAGALVLLVFGLIQGYAYGWIRPATDVEILGLTWPESAPVSIIPFILALGLTLAVLFFRYESRRMDAGSDVLADVRPVRLPVVPAGQHHADRHGGRTDRPVLHPAPVLSDRARLQHHADRLGVRVPGVGRHGLGRARHPARAEARPADPDRARPGDLRRHARSARVAAERRHEPVAPGFGAVRLRLRIRAWPMPS